MAGLAMRSAVAMGLNLRIEGNSITPVSKEIRYRLWWGLYMLDVLLCVMTGRPSNPISTTFCTTPLPVPHWDESFSDERIVQLIADHRARRILMTSLLSNGSRIFLGNITDRILPGRPSSNKKGKNDQAVFNAAESVTPNFSLYLIYAIDLTHVMRDAIDSLHSPGTSRKSWLEMERAISALNDATDDWLSRLPAEFRFTGLESGRPFVHQRISLAFHYYSTKLVITQPCLRRLAYGKSSAGSPGILCDTMAAMAIQVASQMLDLLPDEPNTAWLYNTTPWWCVIHYIMQSIAVLLSGLYIPHTQRGNIDAARIRENFRKATRWLSEMSTGDPLSRRAWSVCKDLITRHGSKLGLEFELWL